MARTIAIGDIHGCANALRAVLAAIDVQPDDTLVTLGDYCDRGPDTKGVIDEILALAKRCTVVPILGNHEEMMLDVVAGGASPQYWLQYGGTATLDSYGFSGDLDVVPPEHVEFLQSLVRYHEIDTHFFTHANYYPDVPLDQQPSKMLQWRSLKDYVPGPHQSGKVAIVGHTPDKTGEIFSLRHLKCIDTYCYGGRWLTALDIATGEVWQADDDGELR